MRFPVAGVAVARRSVSPVGTTPSRRAASQDQGGTGTGARFKSTVAFIKEYADVIVALSAVLAGSFYAGSHYVTLRADLIHERELREKQLDAERKLWEKQLAAERERWEGQLAAERELRAAEVSHERELRQMEKDSRERSGMQIQAILEAKVEGAKVQSAAGITNAILKIYFGPDWERYRDGVARGKPVA